MRALIPLVLALAACATDAPVRVKPLTADDLLLLAGLLREDGVIPPVAEWSDEQKRAVRWGCVGSMLAETPFDSTGEALCARVLPEIAPVPVPKPAI